LFREVDHEMTVEFLGEKAETCTPDAIRTLLATLKKLQESLHALNWIREAIVPVEWQVSGRNPPRGPYTPDEATAICAWVETRHPEYNQALRFILSSGARIDETLHLRADKICADEKRVELIGKVDLGRNRVMGWMRCIASAISEAVEDLPRHSSRLAIDLRK
jgi:hypothetical protein